MTDRELMQQAQLEKLEGTLWILNQELTRKQAEIAALRERLAQPEQEPVAWGCNRYIEDDNGFQIGTDEPELVWGKYAPDDNGWWPLYTTPLRREWVGLTGEELDLIARTADDLYDAALKSQAKLKEKNGRDEFTRH